MRKKQRLLAEIFVLCCVVGCAVVWVFKEKGKLKIAPKLCFSGLSPYSPLLFGNWENPKSLMNLRHIIPPYSLIST